MASPKNIEISQLSLYQLDQLKQQLDQEIDFLASSIQQLKLIQTKFQESCECLAKISADSVNKEILVPLTGSMYVPGKVEDPEHVLVDIGTGYFVVKDKNSAKDYFKRRIEYVTKQMEKIQQHSQEKMRFRQTLWENMQLKLQAQIAAQQQQQHATQ